MPAKKNRINLCSLAAAIGFFLQIFLGGTVGAEAETLGANAETTGKIKASIAVFNSITSIPEGIPHSLLQQAQAIAIIPEVIKVGFVFAGRYGQGVLLIRGQEGDWENPIFISFTGGSVGWQFGLQATDIILIFKSLASVDSIRNGKFTLGIDAAIAAGPVGRQAEAGTDIQMKAEIYSYSRSQGMFAGLSFEGSALQVDYQKTLNFYGRSLSDINNWDVPVPEEVTKIKEILRRHSLQEQERAPMTMDQPRLLVITLS